MSNLSCFMRKNVKESDIEEYVASKRFVDEDGKPVKWQLKCVPTSLDEQIRKDCTKVTTNRRGQRTQDFDTDKYGEMLSVACTVYPNLNDAALQDDWGVKSGGELLKAMLSEPGEYNEYKLRVMEICGYNASMEELVGEAKN